jgi:hypothetical protein
MIASFQEAYQVECRQSVRFQSDVGRYDRHAGTKLFGTDLNQLGSCADERDLDYTCYIDRKSGQNKNLGWGVRALLLL